MDGLGVLRRVKGRTSRKLFLFIHYLTGLLLNNGKYSYFEGAVGSKILGFKLFLGSTKPKLGLQGLAHGVEGTLNYSWFGRPGWDESWNHFANF